MNIKDLKPKSLCIILDPPHGKDVPGKQSPDGLHKEHVWGRERIKEIMSLFKRLKSNEWDLKSPFVDFENEPGLLNRVLKYNEISKSYDMTVVISLHNDAFKGTWWKSKGGFTFFTSRGDTDADIIASYLGNLFKMKMPRENYRFDYALTRDEVNSDLDREANFTVIAGTKKVKAEYLGILIENLFMDVKSNYLKLTDNTWNNSLVDTYVMSIGKLVSELGFDNFISQIKINHER